MIRTIVKREFLDNLLSFKFIACVLVAIILTVISTTFLANDYKDRLKDYNVGVAAAKEALTTVPVYSYLEVRVFKKPNPLSIFVSGIERETGNYVDLTHRDIPASLKGGRIKNEFSRMFSFFDLSSVVGIIFTLLAILLSYNSVSGEKEEGVLSLVLANQVPRYKILLGKYLGMLFSLVAPLTLLFLLGILIVLLSKDIELNSAMLSSIILLYIFSLAYLSCILLISIFVSSKTRNSFNSLLYLLGFYLVAVFLLPLATSGFAELAIAQKAKYFEKNYPAVTAERDKKIEEALKKIREPRTWRLASRLALQGRQMMKRLTPPEVFDYYKTVNQIEQKIVEEYAQKIDDLRKNDDAAVVSLRKLENVIYASIPSTNIVGLADILADTGEDSLARFMSQIEIYWREYVRYLSDKKAFGLRYFYPYPEQFTAQEKELMDKIAKDYVENRSVGTYQGRYFREAYNYNPEIKNLDLSDLPIFTIPGRTSQEKIRQAIPQILILVIYNLLFLTLAHFSFNHYDPRRDA